MGDYTATFTISDAEYNVDAVVTIHVVEAPEPGTMIVGAIDLSENVINKNFSTCVGVVTVLDLSDAAVSGAWVSATWSDLYNADVQGTTNENGQVTFETGTVRNPNGYFTLTVTNVEKADWTYDPDQNVVTEATLGVGDYAAGQDLVGIYIQPIPDELVLESARPNPFNDRTVLRYGLPDDANVRINIYDQMGRHVKTLFSGHQSEGWYSSIWTPNGLSAGQYIIRLENGSAARVERVLFLK